MHATSRGDACRSRILHHVDVCGALTDWPTTGAEALESCARPITANLRRRGYELVLEPTLDRHSGDGPSDKRKTASGTLPAPTKVTTPKVAIAAHEGQLADTYRDGDGPARHPLEAVGR
jgi:hypothetical protein